MKTEYILTSERLGFRNWTDQDLEAFAAINSNPEVMEHFPQILSLKETAEFINRLKARYAKNGYCYFATEILETGEFIGFIGLDYKDFKSNFTPAVDIGWRLKKSVWGKGYAPEGAKRCLEFAFDDLNLEKIIAICPETNVNSEKVMKKIGMKKIGVFKHPLLHAYPDLENCLCYQINRNVWNKLLIN